MRKKYFVEYTEYAGFGQLTVTREMFADWISMRRFVNNLRKDQVIDFGEAQPQTMDRRAAA